MDLELTDVQQELGTTLGRLLKGKYDAESREAIRTSDAGWSEDMWNQFAELGLMSLPFAEEHGGAGMTFAEVAVVMEAFGRALVLEPYLPTVILGGGLVDIAGTDEQKSEVLPGVAAGETRMAFAAQEPGSFYDVTEPQTKAVGSGQVQISGEKSNVVGGAQAHTFVVTAQSEQGLALHLVQAEAQGVTVDQRTQADGLSTAHVTFDSAPATQLGTLVGQDAQDAVQRVLDIANAALASEAVGAMEVALKMTAEYLKTREQFGAPIGVNQVLQHRASDLYAALEFAKSMALYAKLAITQDPDGTSETRHRDVLAAKYVIDDTARLISQEAIQMHGGIGMTMEYPIGHYAKRLTVIPRTFDSKEEVTRELSALGGLIKPEAADLK